jgi:hypothetical protein
VYPVDDTNVKNALSAISVAAESDPAADRVAWLQTALVSVRLVDLDQSGLRWLGLTQRPRVRVLPATYDSR